MQAAVVPPAAVRRRRIDLMAVPAVRWVLLSPAFPYLIQLAMLGALVALAWLGWGLLTPSGVPDKLYAKANLVNLVVWGIFWPSIIWVTVVFGRVWCAVCPLELVSNVSERAGAALGVRQGSLPAWLRAGWLMVILYAALQMLVAGVHLHRVPAYTAIFLFAMIGTAAVTGLLLRDRAYCRGFCPIAPLLKVYGRGGVFAVRSGGSEGCERCTGKTCVSANLRSRMGGRSCPTLLNPATLDSSEDCLLCGQCLKNCKCANMRALVRPPFAVEDRRVPLASWPVTLFVLALSGFVTSEVASEWAAAKAVFLMPVEWAVKGLGIAGYAGCIEGFWTIVVFPLLLWLTLSGIVLLLRGAGSLAEAARRIALPLAVVIAAGQMAKGLAKFVSWVGFLPLAWDTPDGIRTSAAIAAKTMKQPASLISLQTVSIVGLMLLAMSVWFSLREFQLANGVLKGAWFIPVAAMASLFVFVVFGWGFLQ